MSDMWKKKWKQVSSSLLISCFISFLIWWVTCGKKKWEWLSFSLEISYFLPFLNGWVTLGIEVIQQTIRKRPTTFVDFSSFLPLSSSLCHITTIYWAKLKRSTNINWKHKTHHISQTEIPNHLPPPSDHPNLHHYDPRCRWVCNTNLHLQHHHADQLKTDAFKLRRWMVI